MEFPSWLGARDLKCQAPANPETVAVNWKSEWAQPGINPLHGIIKQPATEKVEKLREHAVPNEFKTRRERGVDS
jgi:hypothetical protein